MMRNLVFAASAVALCVVGLHAAHAKRMPPPKTEICNKSKHKQYIATMNYAGRGMQAVRGWTFIAPGKCHTFSDDRFYVRSKARVTGLVADSPRKACVKATKVFDQVGNPDDLSDAAACKKAGGHLVEFRSPVIEMPASGFPRTAKPVTIHGKRTR